MAEVVYPPDEKYLSAADRAALDELGKIDADQLSEDADIGEAQGPESVFQAASEEPA